MASTTGHLNESDDLRRGSSLDRRIGRLLRISEVDRAAPREQAAQRLFSVAMMLSAFRCILSYLILPFLLPALGLGATAGVGPAIGLPVGLLALAFDARGIRRFWIADYRYKWQMTAIYVAVMALVATLVVRDIIHLA